MRQTAGLVFVCLLSAGILSTVPSLSAFGAELSPGKWTGKMISKGRQIDVSYSVDQGSRITMAMEGEEYKFEKVTIKDDKLSFGLTFSKDEVYQCELENGTSSGFEGACKGKDSFTLVMVPPNP